MFPFAILQEASIVRVVMYNQYLYTFNLGILVLNDAAKTALAAIYRVQVK